MADGQLALAQAPVYRVAPDIGAATTGAPDAVGTVATRTVWGEYWQVDQHGNPQTTEPNYILLAQAGVVVQPVA